MKHEYPHTRAEIDENPWEEATEEQYYYMLGVLPPAYMDEGAFMVGEPLCHTDKGRPVYQAYVELDGKFYHKPESRFDADAFRAEIRKQLLPA